MIRLTETQKKTARLRKFSPTLGQAALLVGIDEVGTKEDPANSNDGPRIRQYQSTTEAFQISWGASFITWCFFESGTDLGGVAWSSSSSESWFDTARANNQNGTKVGPNNTTVKTIRQSQVIEGDIVLFDWDRESEGIFDRVGLVNIPPTRDGMFQSLEGNIDYDEQSNGGQVIQIMRNVLQVVAWVRVS